MVHLHATATAGVTSPLRGLQERRHFFRSSGERNASQPLVAKRLLEKKSSIARSSSASRRRDVGTSGRVALEGPWDGARQGFAMVGAA